MKAHQWTRIWAFILAATNAFAYPSSQSQQILTANSFNPPPQNATYDYVVVGGGTGGLTMAYRLAESGRYRVAVVEAGGFYQIDGGNTSVVPAYNQAYNDITVPSQWNMPLVDWGFLTTAQAGAQGQRFHYGRGKMLGGCSAENAMNYNRPTVGTLETWANDVNDTSYTWSSFLPYFQKSITYSNPNTTVRAANATVPYLPSDNTTNNTTYPLQVSHPNWAAPLSSWAQLAFRDLNIPDVHDLINGQLIGSQYSPLTLNPTDQTRSSSQTSFLDAALDSSRTNLRVYVHSLATKILFDDNKTAYGVVVQSGSSPHNFVLSATKEVVVSAGAFQSPQLLMVSGVGPSETLNQHGIKVVADRPGVGQNMWDHVVLTFAHQVNVETYGRLMDQNVKAKAESDYIRNHEGILTNDMSDYLGWENLPTSFRTNFTNATISDLSGFPQDWPEVEYEVSSAPFGTPAFSTPERPIDVGYLQPVLLTPLSRGNVSISSANMSDPPLINPNWLTHPTDQQVAIATFKRGRQFFNSNAIKPILIGEELVPGQDLPVGSSDADILKYLQANIGFNWHASCTCKMGRRDDPKTVVDSQARVIGVSSLRVVDASAFPLLPPGHPQATVYALAEKIAADMLNNQ